jgi:hypothetical protein
MANYQTANLVKAQTIITAQHNSGEKRFRIPVTLLEMLKSTEYMIPSHKVVRTREDRTVEVNYLKRTARSLGTGGRIHNHVGTKGDSGIITPAWTPYSDKFMYSLKQGDNNLYDLDMQIANELSNVIGNFAEGIEAVAATYLHTNKTGINPYTRQGSFNATTDALEITESTYGDYAIQITKTMMDSNKYQGMGYVIFCDSVAYNKFEKQANQGSANSTNLSFQYSGVTFIKSLELDALAVVDGYTKGYWIVAPVGTFGVLDWITKQNREGIETKENKYGTLLNPVDGLLYATHEYEERFDGTSTNGYSQDVKKEIEISIDLAFVTSPLSNAGETVLHAVALV